jgi:hypothetical protein
LRVGVGVVSEGFFQRGAPRGIRSTHELDHLGTSVLAAKRAAAEQQRVAMAVIVRHKTAGALFRCCRPPRRRP